MKKLSTILAALNLIIALPLLAQERTLFHYPLNIGDFWEYRYYLQGLPFTFLTRKVIGDTLMPNGKVYRIIEEYSPPYGTKQFFHRINEDSTEVFQFYVRFEPPHQLISDEFVLYQLNLKVGDSWRFPISGSPDSARFQVTQIADTSLGANRFKFVRFFSPEFFERKLILADSLGIFYESFEGAHLELLGAKINNRIFGAFIFTSVRSPENSLSGSIISSFIHYPNPSNHSTTIEYELNSPGNVQIFIFTVLGERVKILDDSFKTPGLYRKKWFGNNEVGEAVSSGIYFYTIKVNETLIAKKTISFLK